jgi:hypothetical protein
MRAPVFRNIETRNTLLGLTFPFEVVFVLVVFYATVRVSALACAATTLVAYVAVRIVNYGRAPGFLQHWVVWQVRQFRTAGLLSAAARARCPRFPFAPHHFRDGALPRKGDRHG